MNDTTRSPELPELFDRIRASAVADVRVAIPARVERWDAALQQVDVTPLVRNAYEDEDGTRQVEDLPVIPNVPVCFPRGKGANGKCYSLKFPVNVGSEVLLIFSDKSLDKWLAVGGKVDPADDHAHNLTDAMAIPGISDFAHPLASIPDDCVTIGEDGKVSQGVALGERLDTYLTGTAGLIPWLTSLATWAGTVSPSWGGGSPPSPISSMASTVVKVTT
jgi:hypothetical protein